MNRYCYETASGAMVIPWNLDELSYHLEHFVKVFQEKAIPSSTTWVAYFTFFAVQTILASIMPGLTMEGLPTAPDFVRLKYLCNGYECYYFCLFGLFLVHYQGLFPLSHIADHYGEYLVASVIIGDVTSLMWYLVGLFWELDPKSGKMIYVKSYNHERHTPTGFPIYDFFMGTILYPRIGNVDIKMVAEARWSWITLAITTYSCAVKQYETLGYISPQMAFMVLAHWLYSNATVKGEHYITPTWDMFYEKFGWMLNFWNIAGVPYLYCFQSYYVLKNQTRVSEQHNMIGIVLMYVLLIIAYYIFDSANCQKASYKIRGIKRATFPQVPWGVLEEPIRVMKTPRGNLLIDGWYKYARKMQYTGDILMALCWGLICGFDSLLPYFYVVFFTLMILHRQSRDEIRCAEKYGAAWKNYVKEVPNVFVPDSRIVGDFFEYLFEDGEKSKKIA